MLNYSQYFSKSITYVSCYLIFVLVESLLIVAKFEFRVLNQIVDVASDCLRRFDVALLISCNFLVINLDFGCHLFQLFVVQICEVSQVISHFLVCISYAFVEIVLVILHFVDTLLKLSYDRCIVLLALVSDLLLGPLYYLDLLCVIILNILSQIPVFRQVVIDPTLEFYKYFIHINHIVLQQFDCFLMGVKIESEVAILRIKLV